VFVHKQAVEKGLLAWWSDEGLAVQQLPEKGKGMPVQPKKAQSRSTQVAER
jgi:hypothetical protein